ncbi:co-chaperone GroES [bacterium]|nr:co-chaperone GroES [bacterium]
MATGVSRMKLKPLEDRVLVQPLDAEEVTAGGIVLPDAAKEKPLRGTVIAAGPGRLNDSGERDPMNVAVGDEVVYGQYAGSEVTLDGTDYKVLREADILAKVVNQ